MSNLVKITFRALLICFFLVISIVFWVKSVNAAGFTVSGNFVDPEGEKHRQKMVVFLRDNMPNSSNYRRIAEMYVGRRDFSISSVESANYTIEVYFEKDLNNPSLEAQAFYTQNFTVGFNDYNFDSITMPSYERCERGETFIASNEGGTCSVLNVSEPSYSTERIEDLTFAFVNYFRKKALRRYSPDSLSLSEDLEIFLEMQLEDRIDSLDDEDDDVCDIYCNFNNQLDLTSVPQGQKFYNYRSYDRINRETGEPKRYLSEYKLAYKIARRAKYRYSLQMETFAVSIEQDGYDFYILEAFGIEFSDDEKEELEDIVDGLDLEDDDTIEKARKIHNWIAANIEYNTKPKGFGPHTSVIAYREGKAVCDGYSELFRYMMDLAGEEAEMVVGRAPRLHAWNKVLADGEDLYVDVTWDSGYVEKREFIQATSYTYFMIPKQCILMDHYEFGDRRVSKARYYNENADYFSDNCYGIFNLYAKYKR